MNMKHMIHLISYGNERFENSKKRLYKEATSTGWFDTVTIYEPKDLDKEFQEKFKEILKLKRGGGYWIWKSHIIQKTLEKIQDGDILIYLDAGCSINKNGKKRFYEYIDMLKNSDEAVISFQLKFVEKVWTTETIFEYFGVGDDIKNSGQLLGGVRIMKKNPKLLKLAALETKALHDDPWMFTDRYNKNHKSYFRDNRHDQSVYSIIRKIHNSIVLPDETCVRDSQINHFPFWATRKRI